MQHFIAYRRVSREDIGTSAPSLAEQERRISNHVRGTGEVLQWFEEIESGLYDDRPVLTHALEEAGLWGLTLIVSDPCRLTMSHSLAVKLARLPTTDLVVSSFEPRLICTALAACKSKYWEERALRRGVVLEGSTPVEGAPWEGAVEQGTILNTEKLQWAEDTLDFIDRLVGKDMGHEMTATALNLAGYRTRNGRQFNYQAVYNLRKLGGLA